MQPLFTIMLGAPNRTEGTDRTAGVFSNDDLASVERIIREETGFDGFSIAKLTGFWRGQPEECVEIKILTDDLSTVKGCARRLQVRFKQDSVLVTCQGTGTFLTI